MHKQRGFMSCLCLRWYAVIPRQIITSLGCLASQLTTQDKRKFHSKFISYYFLLSTMYRIACRGEWLCLLWINLHQTRGVVTTNRIWIVVWYNKNYNLCYCRLVVFLLFSTWVIYTEKFVNDPLHILDSRLNQNSSSRSLQFHEHNFVRISINTSKWDSKIQWMKISIMNTTFHFSLRKSRVTADVNFTLNQVWVNLIPLLSANFRSVSWQNLLLDPMIPSQHEKLILRNELVHNFEIRQSKFYHFIHFPLEFLRRKILFFPLSFIFNFNFPVANSLSAKKVINLM